MEERILYKTRTIQSKEHPTEYMSIIIDGMNACYVSMKLPKTKGIFNISFIFFLFFTCLTQATQFYKF
jgi:hypothetical protein